MEDLIKALQIFYTYSTDKYPTHCEHDVLYVTAVEPDVVSNEDTKRLHELGFIPSDEYNCFMSFRFGSSYEAP